MLAIIISVIGEFNMDNIVALLKPNKNFNFNYNNML